MIVCGILKNQWVRSLSREKFFVPFFDFGFFFAIDKHVVDL